MTPLRPRRAVDWGAVLVVLLIVAAVLGVLLLPLRKAWNADGDADERRERRERDADEWGAEE